MLRCSRAPTLSDRLGWPLDVGTSDVEVEDENEDRQSEDPCGRSVAEADAADCSWLADVVGEGGSEWSRDDVREPERRDAVQAESPCKRRDEDDNAEEDARCEIAQVERHGGEVAERSTEGEGSEYGRPIEGFTSLRGDAMDRECSFAPIPAREDCHEHNCPKECRASIGNADVEVEEVERLPYRKLLLRTPGTSRQKRDNDVSQTAAPARRGTT